jgi:hypothetical protein
MDSFLPPGASAKKRKKAEEDFDGWVQARVVTESDAFAFANSLISLRGSRLEKRGSVIVSEYKKLAAREESEHMCMAAPGSAAKVTFAAVISTCKPETKTNLALCELTTEAKDMVVSVQSPAINKDAEVSKTTAPNTLLKTPLKDHDTETDEIICTPEVVVPTERLQKYLQQKFVLYVGSLDNLLKKQARTPRTFSVETTSKWGGPTFG